MRSRNPRLDLAALQARIDAALRGEGPPMERVDRVGVAAQLRAIEATLAVAEERSIPRAEWPRDLQMFPFSLASVQRFALRILGLAFRDQHEVNAALVQSSRELLAMNQALSERVAALEARLDAAPARSDRS